MPIITVWNWRMLERSPELIEVLHAACLGIPELGLTHRSEITVCFGGEEVVPKLPLSPDDLLSPLVVVVDLLFDKPERTLEVRQRLAEALGEACQTFLDRCVEVAVKRFSPERDAFWTG